MAASPPPNTVVLSRTSQLTACLSIIRDRNTSRGDFIFYADRVIRLLVEEGLNHLPVRKKTVITPTGASYDGVEFEGKIAAVSIIRAGEAMEAAVRSISRACRIGKILIQRNEETAQPVLYYSKLPEDISNRFVLLLDPMLATGGSVIKAIDVLIEARVLEERILFLNVLSCPEGLAAVYAKYPKVKVVTAWIDEGLDEKKYIVPGIGDFGDRYFVL